MKTVKRAALLLMAIFILAGTAMSADRLVVGEMLTNTS